MSRKDISPTIVECLRQMFSTSMYSDMTIEVIPKDDAEPRRIFSVHRCIIAVRSNIPIGQPASSFTIRDTSPALFESLLQFMYTDEVGLSVTTVQPMLHLSRKLEVKGLEAECFNYLINRLSIQTVLMVFEEAKESHRDDVEQICKEKILENPGIVQSDEFLSLSPRGLEDLLSMDDLPVDESVIFNSLLNWARNTCQQKGLDTSAQNQKEVIGNILYKVRYIWLTDEFIRKTVIKSGLFTPEDISELLEIKATGEFSSPTFLTAKRNSEFRLENGIKVLYRFIEVCNYEDSGSWICDGDSSDAIGLTASKPVLLLGVSLYGPREKKHGLYQVLLELHDGTQCVNRLKTQILMKKSLIRFQVPFNEPFKLRGGHKYDIVLRLIGPGTYYGALQNAERLTRKKVDGCPQFIQPDIPQFEQDGIMFTFSNSHLGTEGKTDVHRGQMPEILYKIPSEEVSDAPNIDVNKLVCSDCESHIIKNE